MPIIPKARKVYPITWFDTDGTYHVELLWREERAKRMAELKAQGTKYKLKIVQE